MSPLALQRWHRAFLLFSGLFIAAMVTQFGIGWYQRRATALSNLSQSAGEISKQLAYSKRWNLIRFRQAVLPGSYYVSDSNGLSIDIQGFVPALELHVSLNELPAGLRTVAVPETGETWRLLLKQLTGGSVILGVSPPEDITNVDKRLEENARKFGSSLETALRLSASEIDRNLEYAVVDRNQDLRFALGGIPLRTVQNQRFPFNRVIEVHAKDGHTYGMFSVPFLDSSGRTVGVILAFEKLSPQPWFLYRAWLINFLISIVLAGVATLIGIPYIGERFEPHRLLHKALQEGESETVEFKEALRWDEWPGPQQPADESRKKVAERIAVKTIAALLNNRAGGTLLIGIADDKRIVGLEHDYESLLKAGEPRSERDKDRDRFQVHLRNLLASKIGGDVINLYVQTAIVEADGKDVCIVHASPAAAPVYISEGKSKAFYLRDGPSTKPLDVEKTVAYVEQRWPKALWRRVWNTLHIL